MSLFNLNDEYRNLAKLESELSDYKKARNALDFKGHQSSLHVSINGCVDIKVTEMNRAYLEVPKRGMDMIVLGVKKLYNAKIQEVEVMIDESRLKIKNLAIDIATKK